MSFELSSDFELISRLSDSAENYFKNFLSQSDVQGFCIVLKQILENTIVHSNKMIASRNVVGTIEYKQNREIHISIEDDGDGYDNPEYDLSSLKGWRFSNGQSFIRINLKTERLNNSGIGIRTTADLQFVDA